MDKIRELLRLTKEGNEEAREKLILDNVGLIWSVVRRFTNRGYEPEDLFQIGSIGLMKAVDKFDLSYDVKFSTYAVPMILGEVKRYLRDNNSVRIARSIKDISYKALKVKEQLTNKFNREPTVCEIAKELNLTEFEVSNALDSMKETISMFEPIYNDGGDTIYLSDQLEEKNSNMKNIDIKIALKDAIESLKEREKYIINQRYLIGKTQMELALELGISQAQISRLEKSGIENIRKKFD